VPRSRGRAGLLVCLLTHGSPQFGPVRER
jgi:hypothetical protein